MESVRTVLRYLTLNYRRRRSSAVSQDDDESPVNRARGARASMENSRVSDSESSDPSSRRHRSTPKQAATVQRSTGLQLTDEPVAGPSGLDRPGPSGLGRGEPSGLGRGEPSGLDRPGPSGLVRGEPSGLDRPGPSGIGRGEPSGLDRSGPSGLGRGEPSGLDRPGPSGLDRPGPSGLGRGEPSGLDRPGPSGLSRGGLERSTQSSTTKEKTVGTDMPRSARVKSKLKIYAINNEENDETFNTT